MRLMEEYRRAQLFAEAGHPIEASRILAPIVEAEPGNAEIRCSSRCRTSPRRSCAARRRSYGS